MITTIAQTNKSQCIAVSKIEGKFILELKQIIQF